MVQVCPWQGGACLEVPVPDGSARRLDGLEIPPGIYRSTIRVPSANGGSYSITGPDDEGMLFIYAHAPRIVSIEGVSVNSGNSRENPMRVPRSLGLSVAWEFDLQPEAFVLSWAFDELLENGDPTGGGFSDVSEKTPSARSASIPTLGTDLDALGSVTLSACIDGNCSFSDFPLASIWVHMDDDAPDPGCPSTLPIPTPLAPTNTAGSLLLGQSWLSVTTADVPDGFVGLGQELECTSVEGADIEYQWESFLPGRSPTNLALETFDPLIAPPGLSASNEAIYGWRCRAVRQCSAGEVTTSLWSQTAYVQLNN
jgi:hypothetical protein